jgi:chromosome segregation ATPase
MMLCLPNRFFILFWLNNNIIGLHSEVEAMRAETRSLHDRLDDANSAITRLTNDHQILTQSHADLTAAHAVVTTQHDTSVTRSKSLEQQVIALNNEITTSTQARDRSQQQVALLQQQLADITDAHTEVHTAKRASESELQRLNALLNDSDHKYTAAVKQMDDLHAANEQLLIDIASLREQSVSQSATSVAHSSVLTANEELRVALDNEKKASSKLENRLKQGITIISPILSQVCVVCHSHAIFCY